MMSGHVKSLNSLQEQTTREGRTLARVLDLIEVRVVMPTLEECRRVIDQLHRCYRQVPSEDDDYVVAPKSNGYRSIHTTLLDADSRPVEVQIRTLGMHFEAEAEDAAHGRYNKLQGSGESLPQSLPLRVTRYGR